MRTVFILAMLALSPCAHAVFKCTDTEGKITFSDLPCAAPGGVGGTQEQVKAKAPPVDIDNAVRLKMETDQYNIQRLYADAAERGLVLKGMSPSHVRRAFGAPDHINDNGGHVQWVYESSGGNTYVYFRNNVVH
ncbi:DUF4124 domain-containing protein [Chitiniphilus eburneus]|uniref:DUF4124 domain-containing protein n=1 Tax=Chitiniphilus eburneus TaxID=2571148 RepID=A0A4U0PXE4_9NEIS|nr:DUF4124 domain-containing protein [Chitiniphilus eburneus]TJZ73207.1 DUF4124 domain-containing protein [Chitiniphilus eburneus]